ncbi:MAG: hypothetical protein EOO02_22595, partial [Chitinophagaceae bacterium]
MRPIFIIFLLSLTVITRISAQEVSVQELISMVKLEHFSIDTLMKKKGYRLMQKDIDSVSSQYYYSNLQRVDNGPSWVRALSYVDLNLKDVSSRVLTYRTYNRDEYVKMLTAMLAAGYKTKETFEFKDASHTIFTNAAQDIRVKITNNK